MHLVHVIMMRAIDLDTQPSDGAIKVQHIRTDRMLPPKPDAVVHPFSKTVPKQHFGQAQVSAQASRPIQRPR
jgi:hypothetical protein